MRAAPRPLFFLHSDAVLRERVYRAGAACFQFVRVETWEALARALAAAPPTALAVVDPYAESPGRRALSAHLQALLDRFPSVAVLAALEMDPARLRDLRTLGEWGVSELIALDRPESAESIARRLRSARGRALRSLLARTLPPFVSGRGRAILAAAAEIAPAGGQGRDLAEALHLSERSLVRWCERARLPQPRRVLAWMRILHAAERLDHPEETVLSVAHSCGYATDSSLRRSLQELAGGTPSRLRPTGVFSAAADAFLAELVRLREEAPRTA